MPYKLLIFTCYGGCATGVAASKACIKLWEENPEDVKVGCLPAVIVPWKLNEIRETNLDRCLRRAMRCKINRERGNDSRPLYRTYLGTWYQKGTKVTFK